MNHRQSQGAHPPPIKMPPLTKMMTSKPIVSSVRDSFRVIKNNISI